MKGACSFTRAALAESAAGSGFGRLASLCPQVISVSMRPSNGPEHPDLRSRRTATPLLTSAPRVSVGTAAALEVESGVTTRTAGESPCCYPEGL